MSRSWVFTVVLTFAVLSIGGTVLADSSSQKVPPTVTREYSIAAKLADKGKLQEAIPHYRQGLSAAVDDHQKLVGLRGIADIYLRQGKHDLFASIMVEAEKSIKDPLSHIRSLYKSQVTKPKVQSLINAIEKAVKGKSDLIVTRIFLIELMQDTGKSIDAQPIIKYVYQNSNDPRVLMLVVDFCRNDTGLGKLDLKACEKLVKLAPNDAENLVLLAETYKRHGMNAQALDTARKIVAVPNASGSALVEASKIFESFEQYDAAIDTYRKAIKVDPGIKKVCDLYMYYIYIRQGHIADALQAYKAYGRIEPDRADKPTGVPETPGEEDIYKWSARRMVSLENAGSTDSIQDLIRYIPDATRSKDASIHERHDKYADALASEIKSESGLYYCKLLLAELYEGNKRFDEARQIVTEVLPQAKSDDMLIFVAYGCDIMNDFPLCIMIYKRIMELNPDSFLPHALLSRAYLNTDDKESAVKEAREIVIRWPNDAQALENAGVMLCESNQVDEGIAAFVKAIKINDEKKQFDLQHNCLRYLTDIYVSRHDKVNTRKYAELTLKRVKDASYRKHAQEKLKEIETWK